MDIKQAHSFTLLKFLLPLIGWTKEPITTLTMTYINHKGNRIGISFNGIHWWND